MARNPQRYLTVETGVFLDISCNPFSNKDVEGLRKKAIAWGFFQK
jgi:hypothetical protein